MDPIVGALLGVGVYFSVKAVANAIHDRKKAATKLAEVQALARIWAVHAVYVGKARDAGESAVPGIIEQFGQAGWDAYATYKDGTLYRSARVLYSSSISNAALHSALVAYTQRARQGIPTPLPSVLRIWLDLYVDHAGDGYRSDRGEDQIETDIEQLMQLVEGLGVPTGEHDFALDADARSAMATAAQPVQVAPPVGRRGRPRRIR